MSTFYRNFNHHWMYGDENDNFQSGYSTLDFYNHLPEIQTPTTKTKSDMCYTKFYVRIPSRVTKQLSTEDLKDLGNILKTQIWVETEPSS